MTSPLLSYDPDVNALYLLFSDAEVTETLELSDNVYIDVDADGHAVGFEVLNAAPWLSASLPPPPASAALSDLADPDAT